MQRGGQTDTRERLLQAGIDLLWERSFQATGVDDLCAVADAKKGSFYHFFASKTDLAVAAIEKHWAQVKEAVFEPIFSRRGSGIGQLRRLVETVYKYQLDLASEKHACLGCPFGNLGQEMARQDDRIRVALQEIFLAHCRYIESALNQAVERGEIPGGNNRQRARNVFALLEGAMLLAKVANDPQIIRGVLPALMSAATS